MVSLKELPQRNNHLPVRSVSGIGFSGDSARHSITIRRPCLPGWRIFRTQSCYCSSQLIQNTA